MSDFPNTLEVQILLNLERELREFDRGNSNCLICRWFSSKGVENPRNENKVFSKSFRFIGKDSNPCYTGPGLLVYPSSTPNSKAYIGSFGGGKRFGEGARINGQQIFIGNYRMDEKNGAGQTWLINSQQGKVNVFKGAYKMGVRDGDCFLRDGDHEFNGSIVDGLYDGFCKIKYKTGDYFEGNFVQGQMQGSALIRYRNGDQFNGELQSNEMTGSGRYLWSSQLN